MDDNEIYKNNKIMKTLVSKIPHYIGLSIDWIGKNLSRIKTIGIVLLFVLFTISFISNGCNRDQANKLLQKVTGLDLQNDILSLKNRTLNDSLFKEAVLRKQLAYSNTILQKEKDSLLLVNKKLQRQLVSIPQWLLNMPVDSSYKFLNEIAYNYPGEKKFPFNEPQVKNIHADYLENITLTGLVATLEDQLINCEKIGDNRDSLALSYMKSYSIVKGQKESFKEIADNSEEKATLYKEALNKTNKGKKFWKVTTAIGSIIILILAL